MVWLCLIICMGIAYYQNSNLMLFLLGKRDLADLTNDAILSSVFASDVKEKRTDRSISLQDDYITNKLSKSQQLASILFPDKFQQRRDAELTNKFVKKTLVPATVYTGQIVPAGQSITNNVQTSNEQTITGQNDVTLKSKKPIISAPMSVVEPLASTFDTSVKRRNTMEQQLAVNPALFASNYLPLPGKRLPEQNNNIPGNLIFISTSYVILFSLDQNLCNSAFNNNFLSD